MRISHVSFKDFPPFKDGSIEFPPLRKEDNGAEVQFFVGANGTGKTRLLSLLLAGVGNRSELETRLSRPIKAAVFAEHLDQELVFVEPSGLFVRGRQKDPTQNARFDSAELSRLGYRRSNQKSLLACVQSFPVTPNNPPSSALAFRGASAEICDSEVTALQPIPAESPAESLMFGRSKNEDKIVGQSMVNLKMGAAMDTFAEESSLGRSTLLSKRLEEAVTKITGRPFSFRVEPHPKVSLRVNWGTAKMMKLVQLPDGLRAIIGWLVSCAAKLEVQFPEHPNPLDTNVMLLIDEPEGHLHPAWQRGVLPAVQVLLPNAQIFAATHSPWVISSVNAGWIHVLRSDSDGTVITDKPVPCSKGDSYIDVVEDILGVTERYDPDTESMLAEFRDMRDRLKSGQLDLEPKLRELARSIADRSESLSDMMGREMWQLDRQREALAEAK